MKPVPSQIFNAIVPAPFGALGIRTAGDQLREVVYLPPSFDEKAADSAIAERSAQQLARYLLDPDFSFDLPRGMALISSARCGKKSAPSRAAPCAPMATWPRRSARIRAPWARPAAPTRSH